MGDDVVTCRCIVAIVQALLHVDVASGWVVLFVCIITLLIDIICIIIIITSGQVGAMQCSSANVEYGDKEGGLRAWCCRLSMLFLEKD